MLLNCLSDVSVNRLNLIVKDYYSPSSPTGFIFTFRFLSTWGDRFYIGLNGLVLLDRFGDSIVIEDDTITT